MALWQVCEFGGNDCIKAPSILDRTTTKYVNRLVQRVDAVYRHLRQRCDLPALPTLAKRTNAQAEQQHNEKPKLLQQMRELNAQQHQKEQNDHKDQNAPLKTATSATTKQQQQQQVRKPMTTTRAQIKGNSRAQNPLRATTTATPRTTAKDQVKQQLLPPANVRKKRKLIVFELDDMGIPIARVEYH